MEPIAIIGMACRMPGAPSLEEFWNLLCKGHHGITLIPEDRWDRERTFDPDPEKSGKINTRHGGFIEGIDLFDNNFFRISTEEAKQMDPQQRIMLELTYEALEDAGLSLAKMDGSETGVFVGVMSNDYLRNQTANEYRHIDKNTGCGSGYCMIANRISYQFNLRGPSMAIDSACSSSLISAFMACESLWTHQCSLAVAGGVNLILSPTLSVFYTRGNLSASDGICRTFSRDASGMGRGEGAGILILKRLSDAVADGDNIYAVIRGGAVNHNGRSNGMSSPNRWAQQTLLRKAYEHAGVKPHDLQYVELHGTGTLIGDAIEATALGSVLAEDKVSDHVCLVGSVKTNLGHLEGAAGVAGLIKLALCISRAQLVPSLWYSGPNPHINFGALPLKVMDRLQDWPKAGPSRVGGVSSFGLGGANAHLVLESAPASRFQPEASPRMQPLVLQLSARSEASLTQMTRRYRDLIEGLTDDELSALCSHTLVRPQGHSYRATFVGHNRDEMISQISSLISATSSSGAFSGQFREVPKRKCIFVFPDFGVADFHPIEEISRIHPCIKATLMECDRALQEVLLRPVKSSLAELCEHSINPEARAVPFIHFGLQIALAALWRTAGFEPDAVAGIGMGRVASWLVSGAIDIKSAMARIAAANHLGLSAAGLACLQERNAFVTDCYSPSGKNAASELVRLLDSEPMDARTVSAFYDSLHWKEADYFLQSLDTIPSRLIGHGDGHRFVTAVTNCQDFWLQLARLSIYHNVQWGNFVVNPHFMHLPRYTWQHSRFWLATDQNPSLTIGDGNSNHAAQVAADCAECGPSTDNDLHLESEKFSTAEHHFGSGLDRERLLSLPDSERKSVLATYIKERVAETLRLSADQVEEPQTFTGLGIDSITALQLKNRVETDLKMPVSLVKLLDGHSIGDFATDLLSEGLSNVSMPGKNSEQLADHSSHSSEPTSDQVLSARIAEMSAEDLDQILSQLLAGNVTSSINTMTINERM